MFTGCRDMENGPLIFDPGGDYFAIQLPCAGDEDCPHGRVCATAINPAKRIVGGCLNRP